MLLRERHGFTGEIRAVGYLIPDLAQFLLRSGFDTAEIADPEQADDLEGGACALQPQLSARLPQPLAASPRRYPEEAGQLDQRLARIKTTA